MRSIEYYLDDVNLMQKQQEKDVLGKVLLTVSALCLVTVAGLLIWGFVLD